MEFLQWNDEKMSIGIILIDDQHKELLRIINQLSTSISEQSQRRDVLMIVDELINYADYHFTTEEELFDKFNYSETEIHKKEHQEFVNKFISMKEKISNDESFLRKNAIEIAQDVFNYIINWFLAHIAGSDRKYIDLFKENQIH
mgnify:CR=1 FL=1